MLSNQPNGVAFLYVNIKRKPGKLSHFQYFDWLPDVKKPANLELNFIDTFYDCDLRDANDIDFAFFHLN